MMRKMKGVIYILCNACSSAPVAEPITQDSACKFCGKELLQSDGITVCKECSHKRQICQRCGAPLRLADFKGVFVSGGTGSLRTIKLRGERAVIAILLKRNCT